MSSHASEPANAGPVPLSALDLVPIPLGATAADALANSLDLARNLERLGYRRHWVAEHHSMPGIASSATAVVIGHLAGGTSTIRVGAGGIMLPNHAPMLIAEQFGTLESLYPGRIDLGLGRAPGADQLTMRAMRRDPSGGAEFPHDVQELQAFLAPEQPGQRIRAVPGAGLDVPIWILGSSLYGARMAAAFGLPYAFASHFAPAELDRALAAYRSGFTPHAGGGAAHAPGLTAPYAMACINVVAADTDEEARRLFTTIQQAFANLVRGTPGMYPPPVDDIETVWTPAERAGARQMLACSVVGGPETVRTGVEAFLARTGVDELMVACALYEHGARVRSYEILAGLW